MFSQASACLSTRGTPWSLVLGSFPGPFCAPVLLLVLSGEGVPHPRTGVSLAMTGVPTPFPWPGLGSPSHPAPTHRTKPGPLCGAGNMPPSLAFTEDFLVLKLLTIKLSNTTTCSTKISKYLTGNIIHPVSKATRIFTNHITTIIVITQLSNCNRGNLFTTRKSSCVKARGIPPRVASARYADLCPDWEEGVPHPVLDGG